MLVTVAIKEEDLFKREPDNMEFCGYIDGKLDPYFTYIECARPIRGQFVQIMMISTEILNMYEVEVIGL